MSRPQLQRPIADEQQLQQQLALEHNASTSCCVTAGPGSACSQGTLTSIDWKYVGEGRGTHAKQPTYNYVGEGQGSYEKEVIIRHEDTCLRKFCLGVVVFSLAALVLVYIVNTMYNGAQPFVEQAQSMDMDASTLTREYDCEAGWSNWKAGWSVNKKAWCCKEFGRACPHGFTSEAYDCQEGVSNWESGWSVSKKEYCCQHHQVGCATGCSSMCTYEGQTASCTRRIQWGADHKFKGLEGACELSRNRVLSHCPSCTSCKLGDSGCVAHTTSSAPYDCHAGLPNWLAGWSLSKKAWCCKNQGLGCETTVAPVGPTGCSAVCDIEGHKNTCADHTKALAQLRFAGQPDACQRSLGLVIQSCSACESCDLAHTGCSSSPTTSTPYDCTAGYKNWQAGWSIGKKAWCCKNQGKACPEINR